MGLCEFMSFHRKFHPWQKKKKVTTSKTNNNNHCYTLSNISHLSKLKKKRGGKHSTLLLFFGRHLELIAPIQFFRCQCMLAITEFFGPIHEYFVGGTLCYWWKWKFPELIRICDTHCLNGPDTDNEQGNFVFVYESPMSVAMGNLSWWKSQQLS